MKVRRANDRRGFIKVGVAGIVGAFFALRNPGPAKAGTKPRLRQLRQVIDNTDLYWWRDNINGIVRDVRPRSGTVELCWIRASWNERLWVTIEVGRTPDGVGVVRTGDLVLYDEQD